MSWRPNRLVSSLLGSVTKSTGDDAYAALIGSVTGPQYDKTVSRNAKSELVIVDKSGTEHPIGSWSAKRAACDNSLIGDNTRHCTDLISDCLGENKDGNPTALLSKTCRDAITSAAAKPGNIKDAVGNMDPRAAFRLLKNLGLKGKKVDGLVRCEPYDEWAKRVEDNKVTKDDKSVVNLTTAGIGSSTDCLADCKTFVKDEKISDFIKLVIGFIDSNKAILNKGASSGASAGYDVNDPFGRKRPRGNDKHGDLSDARTVIEGSLHNMHTHILRLLGNMPTGFTIPHAVQLMGMVGGGSQVGGSAPAMIV